ncbi:AcvB/VirJ family lysyl-phosphatidylglycerol hydrolase [Novosphingobium jiangmenense]|uniref:Type IV secretion system protein VirJ n=1 Tax=Novosphingobium jiangmenense TaxID=2791981 RepID=A0ABS0HHS4_9SPHN|nr:AcvB/VirJ family lysyl-phosphatidylglycerol hydrolase [Novosphingobium jiangmenense]MBF9151817.1 type IV secretion system protein VirJ [Novosphingobium jiangmenense]
MSRFRARRWRWIAIVLLAIVAVATNAPRLHLLGSKAMVEYPAAGGDGTVGAVFLSGDLGLTMGISGETARSLAAHGYPVTAVNSSVAFAHHLTRTQTDAVVIQAIDAALARGARKVVLVGQSFGSDIIATVLPDLPQRLHDRILSVVIVVPSNDVKFRADPSGVAYLGKPDAIPAPALRTVDWVPVTCIHGKEEHSSLCPLLDGSPAKTIALPGNHYLRRDTKLVMATILQALHR